MKNCIILLFIVLTGCTQTLPTDSSECVNVDTSLKGTKVTAFTPTTDQTKCGAHTLPVGALLLDIAVDML